MARLDNPVSRLHVLLKGFQQNAGPDQAASIQASWASTLGVNESEVPRALLGVAALFIASRPAIEATGDTEHLDAFDEHAHSWSTPILHPNHGLQNACRDVMPVYLSTLGSIGASVSRFLNGYNQVPDEDEVIDLVEHLRQAVKAAIDDPDLDPDLRAVIIQRLLEIIGALETIDVSGPDGVRTKIERLMGVLVLAPKSKRSLPAFTAVLMAAGLVYTAVTRTGDVAGAIESVKQVLGITDGE